MWQWNPKLRQSWEKEEFRHQNEKSVSLAHGAMSEGRGNFLHKRKWLQRWNCSQTQKKDFLRLLYSDCTNISGVLHLICNLLPLWTFTSDLCSNSVFSNASLCLSLCYIEAFAVRGITWVVTTWLVFMAAVSEDMWSNQPHASCDIGWAGILKLSVDPGVLGATGMEWNRNNKDFLVLALVLGLYWDCMLIWLHFSRCRYFLWIH